ncbi:hypothetical protein MMC07_000833 [Pseudocyphellaria aurata]|nr:hypothetical protein [Pseudocyphellaria aurata]
MALPATLTNPYSSVEEIKYFLQSLQEFPGSPHGISAPISFPNGNQKASWIKEFTNSDKNEDEDEDEDEDGDEDEDENEDGDEDEGKKMDFTECFTYSESFGEKSKDNTTNPHCAGYSKRLLPLEPLGTKLQAIDMEVKTPRKSKASPNSISSADRFECNAARQRQMKGLTPSRWYQCRAKNQQPGMRGQKWTKLGTRH